MKKTVLQAITMVLCFITSVNLYGQIELKKISFGNFEVPYSHIQYPSTPLGDDYQTYSISLILPQNINSSLMSFFEENIRLKGFQKVENGSDLIITVIINKFDFKEPVTRQNDKYYYLDIQYSYDCQIQLVDGKNNKVLRNYDVNSSKNMRGEVGTASWSENYSMKNDLDKALSNISKIKDNIIRYVFKKTCEDASNSWNYAYGYQLVSENDHLLTMKESDYYYTYFYLRNTQGIRSIFKKANINEPLSEFQNEIAPYIQYYEEVIPLFQKIQPNVAKIVQAASYYNIAKIYYFCDMPDKSLEYVQKGLETGELKSELGNLKSYNETLKRIFSANGVNNRSYNGKISSRLRWR
jgi:hypothetical protein